MISLLMTFVFYLTLIISVYLTGDFQILIGFCVVTSVIMTIITLASHCSLYYDQIRDIETIKEKEDDKEVYKKKAEEITSELKLYLTKEYPEYEKEIMKNFSTDNATILVNHIPNLKASDTIIEYCTQINKLQSDIYNCDLSINRERRDIRVRKRGIFILTKYLPVE